MKKIPAVGGKLAGTAERVKDSLKYLVVSGVFFEEMGFKYLGPIDGHDFEALEKTLEYAKKVKGPVLVHVITKKGKGYKPAEEDTVGTWHGTGPYKMETGAFVKSATKGPAWSSLVAETVRKLHEKMNALLQLRLQCQLVRNWKEFKRISQIVSLMLELQNNMQLQWQQVLQHKK